MILVKLGGSIITDKSRLRTPRPLVISRLAKELMAAKDRVFLVHGAGSFGHILAKKYRLHEGHRDDSQLEGIAEVQRDVRKLNLIVVDALRNAGARPVSIPPGIIARLDRGRLSRLDAEPFSEYLRLGMMPVTFGDVALDTARRFGICSGDDLMLGLSKAFEPSRSLYVTDVDGILAGPPKGRGDPDLLKEVGLKDLGNVKFWTPSGADVTGGIEGKLKKMFEAAKFAKESWILNGLVPGRLRDAVLSREFIGTKVVA